MACRTPALEKRELAGWSTGPSRAATLLSVLPSSRPPSRSAPKPFRPLREKHPLAVPPTPENIIVPTRVYRIGRDKFRPATTVFVCKDQYLVIVSGIPGKCVFIISDMVRLSLSPSFRPGSSTSVLLRVESILYPESYCSLGPTRINSSFDQEDFFDWFRTPHYPALFHAPAAHGSLDHGGGGW